MSTQPEALRLAALLDDPVNSKIYLAPYIAVELRRLHEVNQELLKALQTILDISLIDDGYWAKVIELEASQAISRA